MEKVPDRKERAKISKRKNQSKNAYYKKRSRRPQYQAQAAPYRIGKQIYHAANIVPRLMGSCGENAEFIPESRGDDDGSSPPMLYTGEDWHSGNGDVPYDVVQSPANIERLHQYFNPNDIKFDFTPAFGVCGCEERCTVFSCATAKVNRLCSGRTCSRGATQPRCGNVLPGREDLLSLVRFKNWGQCGLVAAQEIERGTILGEYYGVLSFAPSHVERNEGFRMDFKISASGKPVQVNAQDKRGLVAWANHSCAPNAGFYQVGLRRMATVVVITERDVHKGEELTVSYGDKLWFTCQCGHPSCIHAD